MSFAPETDKLVNDLIQAEYKNACEQWGDKYHSLHEGYAVLLEEVEEVKEISKDFDLDFCHFWHLIKMNRTEMVKHFANDLMVEVEKAISELAQVVAVLMKIKNTLEVAE